MSVEDLTILEKAANLDLLKLIIGSPASYTFSFVLYFNNRATSFESTLSGSGGTSYTLNDLCVEAGGVAPSTVKAVAIYSASRIYYSEGLNPDTGAKTALSTNSAFVEGRWIRFPDCYEGVPTPPVPARSTASATGAFSAAINSTCVLVDLFVSASVAGAFILWDNASAASGTNIFGSINFPVGTTSLRAILPANGQLLANGLFLTLSSGTATITASTRAI